MDLKDVDAFKNSGGAADVLRQVIREVSGVTVKYRAKVADAPSKVAPAPAVERPSSLSVALTFKVVALSPGWVALSASVP